MIEIETRFNENQLIAVNHNNGPMMVLAGPGSGKTTVITYRIKNLIEKYNVCPKNILVITFTKAAKDEMQRRFEDLMSAQNYMNGRVNFGTFHSIFFKIIKSFYGYNIEDILKETEKLKVLKQILIELRLNYGEEEDVLQNLQDEISKLKNDLISLENYHPIEFGKEDFENIVQNYEQYKRSQNKIDFDDMLSKCYELLSQNQKVLDFWRQKYEYILIDEFQDINRIQYETIKLITAPKSNLFIVGDDDQSIYKFRGAKPEIFLNFPKEYKNAKTVTLNVNYRSNNAIVKLSSRLINNNENRYKKEFIAQNEQVIIPQVMNFEDTQEEAMMIAKKIIELNEKEKIKFNDMAVIYRTNIQSRAFVDMFLDLNISFYLRDEIIDIYDHWITKDILAYLELSKDIHNNSALERIINKPNRYINKSFISEAKKHQGYLLENIINLPSIKKWQVNKLEELEYQISCLKNKTLFEAVKYIRDIIGYEAYIKDYSDYRKISPKGLIEVLDEFCDSTKHFDKVEDLFSHIQNVSEELKIQKRASYQSRGKKDAVTLTTMHSAKGLEFDVVFVISVVDGVIPYEKNQECCDLEEERRLMYVAMTRTKKHLYLSVIKNRREEKVKESIFLKEIFYSKEVLTTLTKGATIKHKMYGEGIIETIQENIAKVKFKKQLFAKSIDIEYCIKNHLVVFI